MRSPRYPIYIPSKSRADLMFTAKAFDKDGVSYRVVVEPNEVEDYKKYGDRLLVLPENSKGLVYARNWIKEHAISEGHARHWQFDDDIEYLSRIHKGYRIRCSSNVALRVLEDFVDRYENIALASFNSEFFIPVAHGKAHTTLHKVFYLNARCYTCFLMLNSVRNKWRFKYNEDTDMTLQVLAGGWCTILFNAFCIKTKETMTYGGGQESVYTDDGRLQMARQLERIWPGVVTTYRRFGRPQHKIKDKWMKFDNKLIRRKDIDWEKLAKGGSDNYGLELTQISDKVKSKDLRNLLKEEKNET